MFMRDGKERFIHHIDLTMNDLSIDCMFQKARTVVDESVTKFPTEPFVLLYDMTFQLGDFYASPLIMRHRCLVEESIVPIAVLLHERKLAATHTAFIRYVMQQIPPSVLNGQTQVVFITDREFDFETMAANCTHVFCWRHIIENVKRQTQSALKLKTEMQNLILDNMFSIMKTDTSERSVQKANKYSKEWPEQFCDYYFTSIAPAIRRSGGWVLEPMGMFSLISGITTNASESFNNVIKSWVDWREMPIDVAALAFFNLYKYYLVEYDRAKYGLGNFRLKPGIPLRPTLEMPKREDMQQGENLEFVRYGNIAAQIPLLELEQQPPNIPSDVNAVMRLAQYLVPKGFVGLVTDQQLFIVEDAGSKFMVQFEPYRCTCNAKGCHHVLAARIWCGLRTNIKGTKNIATLRRQQKRTISKQPIGRKAPRIDDYKDAKLQKNEIEFDDETTISSYPKNPENQRP